MATALRLRASSDPRRPRATAFRNDRRLARSVARRYESRMRLGADCRSWRDGASRTGVVEAESWSYGSKGVLLDPSQYTSDGGNATQYGSRRHNATLPGTIRHCDCNCSCPDVLRIPELPSTEVLAFHQTDLSPQGKFQVTRGALTAAGSAQNSVSLSLSGENRTQYT